MTFQHASIPRTDPMPHGSRAAAIACLMVGAIVGLAGGGWAVEPPDVGTKPDWQALEAVFNAGDYGQALAAAEAIAAMSKRKSWDRDYVPRTIDFLRARMWQGFADLRLGRLDAADAAFADAYRAYKDRDFQRLTSLEARQGGARVAAQLVALDLIGVELLNARTKVVLDRLRYTNVVRSDREGPSPEATAPTPEDVDRWLDDLRSLRRMTANSRDSAVQRFGKADAAAQVSPRSRALVGSFWPALIDGMTALELSRLPFVAPPAGGGAQPPVAMGSEQRTALLHKALEHFESAADALREAVAAANPQGGALKPDHRIEVALMEAELLGSRAIARMDAGDLALAREDASRAAALQREVATLRKVQRPDTHPDLLWPLLLTADLALSESHQRLADGHVDDAQALAAEASKTLSLATELAREESHPLRAYLANLTMRLERQSSSVEQTIPQSDEADTAARRLHRAIDGTALPGIAY